MNLPAPQNNLLACQAILNTLYAARQTIATGGLSSIMIDGEQTVFHSSVQLEASIQLWERKVAILNGTRRRIRHIRFCG